MEAESIDQPWRVYYPEVDEGRQARAELANACSNLFGAALGQFYADCTAALRGKAHHGDQGEALEDLTSVDMPLLRHLCRLCDADADRVAAAMIEGLDAGRKFTQAAMNRPVPEVYERFGPERGVRTKSNWREKGGGMGPLSGCRDPAKALA